MKKILYYDYLTRNENTYFLVASEQGLCFLGCTGADELFWNKWKQRHYSEYMLKHSKNELVSYVAELSAYLDKNNQSFSVTLDLAGTYFQKEVWNALQTIPFGQVTTYSSIAEQIKRPKAVRAVANAISNNPLLIVIPCHRVIGKNGSLTGFRSGIQLKEELLKLESIV